MSGKFTVIFLAFILMISGCGTQSLGEAITPAPTEPPKPTATPSATATASAQASVTPTLETPIPTNPADCTNSAVFVADVTIADNETLPASTEFTKTWRIKNTGTCVWGPDYTLTHYAGEKMFAPSSIPLNVTYPGETLDISAKLTAPYADGTHNAYFVVKNPAGLIMKIDNDSRLWVIINTSQQLAAVTQSVESIPVTGGEDGFAKAACAYATDEAKVAEAIKALNSYRADNGLPAYTVNELLTKAATAHANDMACHQLFGHEGSDASTPATRVAASGYSASSVTENVYGSYPPLSGQGAVDWWKNDKTDVRHNQNLLSTTFTEIGVGYSFFDNFGYYVIVFGKPK
jgi:uncharacterized protein YkwD